MTALAACLLVLGLTVIGAGGGWMIVPWTDPDWDLHSVTTRRTVSICWGGCGAALGILIAAHGGW